MELNRQTLEQRAVTAAIWGMPIVSVDAMRQAFFRDAKANYNDVVFWSEPSDWKNQTTTPNASARYVYFNFNTKGGPVVVEIPPAVDAGLFGTLLDAWQVPLADVGPEGEDQGKGGKYLLLPPDFRGDAQTDYIVIRPQTFNGYALFRAIPKSSSAADVSNAIALVKKMRLYPLVKADSPPEQHFVDMTGKLFDGIVRFDGSFYVSLAQMINEEPVLTQNRAMMGLLLPLGIEKGKEFKPDTTTQAVLAQSAREAHGWLMNGLLAYSTHHWPDSRWGVPAAPVAIETAFSFERTDYLDVDARGIGYFSFYAPPKKLGVATFYVGTFKDANGDLLRGEAGYRLRVPPKAPAQQFWALTLYDRETCRVYSRHAAPRHRFIRSEDAKEHRRFGGHLHRSEVTRGQRNELGADSARARLVSLFPLLRAGEAALREDMEAAGHREGHLIREGNNDTRRSANA
jgi:hypothetical protein